MVIFVTFEGIKYESEIRLHFKQFNTLVKPDNEQLAFKELLRKAFGCCVLIYPLIRNEIAIWAATRATASRFCWSSLHGSWNRYHCDCCRCSNRLHGGNIAAVLRAMPFSTSSRSMITPTRLFWKSLFVYCATVLTKYIQYIIHSKYFNHFFQDCITGIVLEMYMKKILQQCWEQYVLFVHVLAQYEYSNTVFWNYIWKRRNEKEIGLLTIFVESTVECSILIYYLTPDF